MNGVNNSYSMSHILYYQMSIELREIDIVETVFGVDDHEDLLAAIQNAGGVSAAEIMDDTGLKFCVERSRLIQSVWWRMKNCFLPNYNLALFLFL